MPSHTPEVLFLLITAHPDDEAMFFLPTLYHLLHQQPPARVWLLCLSRGNYDGLGELRQRELHKACSMIGSFEHIRCWNDERHLPDHPKREWSADVIVHVLETVLRREMDEKTNEIHILTFDEFGVSGHVNHQCTYRGVRKFLRKNSTTPQQASPSRTTFYGWELRSVKSTARKYLSFPRDWFWISWLWLLRIRAWVFGTAGRYPHITLSFDKPALFCQSQFDHFVSLYQPRLSFRAMAAHHSQWVWYRRLFVLFSCYTHHNEWSRIDVTARDEEIEGQGETLKQQ